MDPQEISAITKNFTQTVCFKGSESGYSVSLVAEEVKVACSPGNHNHGSSKVKLTNVVDYSWEHKYYTGHLLAVHVAGKIFAYGIKGKTGGMVRVTNTDLSQRALIKDINGQAQDLSFAHIYTSVILGCVDEEGNLFVHKVEEKPDALVCTLMIFIDQKSASVGPDLIHRVVWCPFLPDEDDCDEDNSTLLLLTHGKKAELLNINLINSKYGTGPLTLSEITEGHLDINEHSEPIMDAAFSPDGTAVATASMDGYVKFFQIYMHEDKPPRCLHEWQPHDGKPLSFLDFLDNHCTYSSDEQFWKFAITGCSNNTELKIWNCESWTCSQTISFVPSTIMGDVYLKARLDLSAGYLILSEINSKVLYILEMQSNMPGEKAYATSISEFLLPAPFVSFGIIEASLKNFRCANSTEDLYPCEENEFEDEQNIVATVIKMFVVQPKRLQECQIVYQTASGLQINNVSVAKKLYDPELNSDDVLIDTTENDETIEKVQLSQLSNMLQNDISKQHFNDLQNLLIQPSQPLNLMTPDAFNSPVKSDLESSIKKEISSPHGTNEPLIVTEPTSSTLETDILFQRQNKDFASGGSSPSREVQEILALNNSSYATHEYFEESPKKDTSKQNGSFKQQNNFGETEWPTAPIIKSTDIENKELLIQECLNAGDSLDHTIIRQNHKNSELQMIKELLVSLMSTVREQNTTLQEFRNELKSLKLVQEKSKPPDDLVKSLEKQIDASLSRSNSQQNKILEHWVSAKSAKDREFQENLATNLSHLILKQVQEKLQTTVNNEIKSSILPLVVGTFDNLKHVLIDDFHQKLSNIDIIIKDSLNKLLSSKSVADSLSNNLAPIIKPSIEKASKDIVCNSLLPSWEKVCNTMFLQINETFQKGTKEYTSSVETYMEKQRKFQDKGRDIVSQMQAVNEVMLQTSEKLSKSVQIDLQQQLLANFATMQEKLALNITEMIKEQISIAFRNHAANLEDCVVNAVRSRAVTPSPAQIMDAQAIMKEIQSLVAQGHINSAFQQALSASDLSLVVYLCERLNPQMVFSGNPCSLHQPVLLSLIQQLSADLINHTELKHKYLAEAVLNLDQENPVTKEHMSTVLRDLNRQLTAFIANNPNHKITRNMKMLQLATQSLLKL